MWWYLSFSLHGRALGGIYTEAEDALEAQSWASRIAPPYDETAIMGPLAAEDIDANVAVDLREVWIPVDHPHLNTVGTDVVERAAEAYGSEYHRHGPL